MHGIYTEMNWIIIPCRCSPCARWWVVMRFNRLQFYARLILIATRLRSCTLLFRARADLGSMWWNARQERWHESMRNCPWQNRAYRFSRASYLVEEHIHILKDSEIHFSLDDVGCWTEASLAAVWRTLCADGVIKLSLSNKRQT